MGEAEGIGAFVRRRRLALGMTQEELAEATRLSQKRISQIEAKREVGYLPSLENLRVLASALECTISELLLAAGYKDESDLRPEDYLDPRVLERSVRIGKLSPENQRLLDDLVDRLERAEHVDRAG